MFNEGDGLGTVAFEGPDGAGGACPLPGAMYAGGGGGTLGDGAEVPLAGGISGEGDAPGFPEGTLT